MPVSDWEGVRLHVVTGKGGTGKTTVAAALALALASGGHKVLLVEVEERQGLAQLFDVAPLPYEERRLAVARDGGDLFGLAVDAQQAMYEYLDLYYRLGRAGRALDRMGIIEFATTVAPGMRDVLLTGKTYEATRRRRTDGGFVYDAVVLDAPPTGRITRFLSVNAAVTSMARVGPVSRHAAAITELISSPRTAVHVVTVLEEMPVQETADTVGDLDDAGISVGAVVVNQVRRPHLDRPRPRGCAAGAAGPAHDRGGSAGRRAAPRASRWSTAWRPRRPPTPRELRWRSASAQQSPRWTARPTNFRGSRMASTWPGSTSWVRR